ncbi:hypothetical protein DAEQUDRAFT_766712 [Daedalea quercina L-15889]|uniref:Uncharacterized protein n=1 Tax=Daedalea quercina L-15889 TaxID=1314783 RepID=A0A165P9U4_9APHY|nr:hypothetical protein DAEQUDRAFT_766712 [Daedalea quercina L-15889]
MAAVGPPPVPDKALPIDPALYDSPSHVDLKQAEPGSGPVPVPFPRESVAGAPSSGVPDGGSKQYLAAIEGRSAPGSGVLTPPRSEASPAASVGHTAGSSHRGAGRTPEPLADARYVASNSPNQASFSTQTKDDDLPPLPTPESEASSLTPGIFRRITKRLRPAASPSDPSEAPPTSFQISLPTRSRSRSRSRPRGDDSSAANAPQPLVGKQRKPHVRIPTVPVPKVPAPAPVPNSFASPENRRAALRARGLVPPPGRGHHQRYERYRDAHGEWMPLSEQEKELDRMFAVVVEDRSPSGENDETEAKKFRDAWLARHRAESEQGHDQAGGASPSLDGHPNGAAVYADGPGSALPSTTDLAHAEPKKHARQASGRGLSASASASASAENFRPDLVPAVDPSLPAIPFEQMAAHRLPQAQARDRRSSDVSERVSRWLQTSLRPRSRSRSADAQRPASAGAADDDAKRARFRLFPRRRSVDASIVPTPYRNESDARRSADVSGWMQSTRSSLDSATPAPQSLGRRPPARKLPPVPPSAFTPVKERYDAGAVVVTASPSPVEAGTGSPLGPANTSRTSLDDGQSLRVRRVQVGHRRGRSATVSDPQLLLQQAPLESSSSLVSRSHHSHTMPALSPTRSTSSSELGLPATPTTDTHGCEPPPPPPPPRDYLRPGSSSGRSQTQQSHSQHRQPARQASQNSLSRAKPLPRLAHHPPAPPLPQRPPAHARDDRSSTESDLDSSYVEVEVDMEFGVRMRSEAQKMRDLMAAAATASARPRPRRESTDRDDSEKRRSLTLGLFTKKEDADAPPKFRNPRATSSMQNMKRTVTGTLASLKPRAKTHVEDDPYAKAPRSPTLPTSPPMANAPPTSFPQAMATPKRRQSSAPQEQSLSLPRSTVGSGARPRQALSPTIYNRGSILVEAGRIEDDESRRLSEMAFLDY